MRLQAIKDSRGADLLNTRALQRRSNVQSPPAKRMKLSENGDDDSGDESIQSSFSTPSRSSSKKESAFYEDLREQNDKDRKLKMDELSLRREENQNMSKIVDNMSKMVEMQQLMFAKLIEKLG